jgi:hypothetical protein
MIKKIFASILILNIIFINFISYLIVPKIKIDQTILEKVVDIKNTNDLINTYSILIMEIVPANE